MTKHSKCLVITIFAVDYPNQLRYWAAVVICMKIIDILPTFCWWLDSFQKLL